MQIEPRDLAEEIRCLRLVVDALVASHDVPWSEVQRIVQHCPASNPRMSWRLTMAMALREAAQAQPKPAQVLSKLPIGL